MKKNSALSSAFFNPRFLVSSAFCSTGLFLAVTALTLYPGGITQAKAARQDQSGAHRFSVVPVAGATTGSQLIISEFRVRGLIPDAATNEYVELYNASGSQLTTQAADGSAGLSIAASDGVIRCVVPNGTIIPAGGHFLCTDSVSYGLGAYPSGSGTTATGDQTFGLDIPDQAGIALFNNATGGASFSMANRLDAVGPSSEANELYREGAGLTPLAVLNYDPAWVRRSPGGCVTGTGVIANCGTVDLLTTTPGPTSTQPQDTGDNAADFFFVDPNGTQAGAGQRLGAPGPQNSTSPRTLDGVLTNSTSLDSCVADTEAPNYVRDLTSDPAHNSTFGTIDLRKTFTNTTGSPITRLRFRIVELTTFPAFTGMADLRPRSSTDLAVTVDRPPCGSGTSNTTVRGTTLEEPPAQPNGGGYNSSMSVVTIDNATPLAAGASIDVRFLLGVQQNGAARFCVTAETEPASASQVACFITPPTTSCATTVFSENFDGVTAPNLPTGWTTTLLNGPNACPPTGTCALGTQWATDATTPDSSPNSAFHNDPSCVTDTTLDSPSIPITSSTAQVTFLNNYNTESTFDGGVIEISMGGGAFTDLIDAGGSFVTGGYNSSISTRFMSPISGRMAWSGDSSGYTVTTANLPPSAAGQNVKLRFRMATDCSVAGTGWRIDTLSIADGGCATALNISTRMNVQAGSNVLIGGFIITGTAAKQVVIRGIGPSLIPFGIADALTDTTLELRAADGTVLAQNDDWQSDTAQASRLSAIGLGLQDPQESGIAATLQPGTSYTAILAGKDGGTGVGLLEIYDGNGTASSQFANISTRGFVLTGTKVMIGGFILGGQSSTGVIVRGVGPSLSQFGISPVLDDPTLELRDGNGALLISNDNWQDDSAQAAQLTSHNLALQDSHESGIFTSLPPGSFTAVLAGKDSGTGIGLVEIYNVH